MNPNMIIANTANRIYAGLKRIFNMCFSFCNSIPSSFHIQYFRLDRVLQSRRIVQEAPGDPELFGDVLRESLDAELLGLVMAAIEDIDP